MADHDAPAWYDREAPHLAQRRAAVPPLRDQPWLCDLLPSAPAIVLDIGAGSGHDARAFAHTGCEVVAVEPSRGMRTQAAAFPPSPRIRWIDDRLPCLHLTIGAGVSADLICLNAVWQHVEPSMRPRAFANLVRLLRAGGLIALTLRHGSSDDRPAWPAQAFEIAALARDHGLQILRRVDAPDPLGRSAISWTAIVLRLPDDGTGALPLLRHLILADAKSATYKLGLLRTLCRAADGAAGHAAPHGDEAVVLPLGLIALFWLRLYLPLLRAGMPQTPGHRDASGQLGFVGRGLAFLLAAPAIAARDLHPGAAFAGAVADALHGALRDAAAHIRRMPARHMTFPDGTPILRTLARSPPRTSSRLVLDRPTLASFGEIVVPFDLWRALGRFTAWIEPSLVTEWTRLVSRYAHGQGRRLDNAALAAAMTWTDPARDVLLPQRLAIDRLTRGESVHCVWSGRRLSPATLDIDHCLPWSAWPCGDLWNLLPADRQLNRHRKRERLPSALALSQASDRMLEWWSGAYLRPGPEPLAERFLIEVQASLPGLPQDPILDPAGVIEGIALQRMRLSRDQGVPEWDLQPAG